MDTIGKKDGNLLSNTCKKQIGVKCCRIPSFSAGNAKTVLKMVDRLFNHYADFICLVPFISSPDGAGKGTQTFFRADIEHATAGRIRTWVLARSAASVLPILAFLPGHLGADELECWSAATKV